MFETDNLARLKRAREMHELVLRHPKNGTDNLGLAEVEIPDRIKTQNIALMGINLGHHSETFTVVNRMGG